MPWKGDQLIPESDMSPIPCDGCGHTHFEYKQLQDKFFLAGAWYYERRIEFEMKCKKCGMMQMQWDAVFDHKTGMV